MGASCATLTGVPTPAALSAAIWTPGEICGQNTGGHLAITAATGLSISQGTFLNEVLDGRLPQSWF